MPATAEDLCAYLTKLGIVFTLHRHAPLHTVAESQALRGAIAGLHTKNLFLRDRAGALFLLSAAEDAAVDLKTLHEKLGAKGRFSFARADQLETFWGVKPGAVTPFGAINDADGRVSVALDDSLLTADIVNFHPLTNDMTLGLSPADLIRFLEATSHPPQRIQLPSRATDA